MLLIYLTLFDIQNAAKKIASVTFQGEVAECITKLERFSCYEEHPL
jgi:hypothetical protein